MNCPFLFGFVFQGGMKAVVWTDALQGVVYMAGIITVMVIVSNILSIYIHSMPFFHLFRIKKWPHKGLNEKQIKPYFSRARPMVE